MERKLWFRVFDINHGNFIELGHFPEANPYDVGDVVRGAVFYEDSNPELLSVSVILDADCEERDYVELEKHGFLFSQFTGKHDSNNTPIFEGDFITIDNVRTGEVVFVEDDAAFEIDFNNGEILNFGAVKNRNIVVTGNRFEQLKKM